MPAEVSVVVVAFGADDLLRECLAPLVGQLPLVVVDNASRSDCRDISESAGAHYLDPGANLGFAGGVNHALAAIDPAHDVLLLNPDARVEADDVRRLAAALREDPTTACVAPAQTHPDDSEPQRVVWPFPAPGRQWLIALGAGRSARQPDFLIGAVLLLSGRALRELGTFDERFFLYCEETDWQRRATLAGWRTRYVPEVSAVHVGAATSSDPGRRAAYFHAAHELYVRKWFGPRGWALYRTACLTGDAVRWLTGGSRRAAAATRLGIYREGPVRHRDRILAGKRR